MPKFIIFNILICYCFPRKKLRADILKQFSSLTESDVTVLVPNKEEMSITKINTSADENILVYFTGKNPIFFQNFKTLYPTGVLIWVSVWAVLVLHYNVFISQCHDFKNVCSNLNHTVSHLLI